MSMKMDEMLARAICGARRGSGEECVRHAFGGDDRDCRACDFAVVSEIQASAVLAALDAAGYVIVGPRKPGTSWDPMSAAR